MGKKKELTSVTLDKEVLQKIDEEAEKEGRSRSNFINNFFRKFFKIK
jgi:metal-responsive CopG/Arc/MetJ family transcriptional regulator